MKSDRKPIVFKEELFTEDEIEKVEARQKYRTLESAIWTERKALLVQLYLQLFVFVTNRGTYIDAFSGPQYKEKPDAWAAKLLWGSDPGLRRRRIDRFEFFEKSPSSYELLEKMVGAVDANKRKVNLHRGDCNDLIPEMLRERPITSPAFCLLDQRSTECSWELVSTIANHKSDGNKIELFYFLMASWKDRSLKNLTKSPDEELRRWWGRDDIDTPKKCSSFELGLLMRERFEKELGYKHVHPFPIFDNISPSETGRMKYWMIHASDHAEAPKFMFRAYNKLASGYDPSKVQEDFPWSREELEGCLPKGAL